MTKAYCKWPAIAGIVVAVLVACLTLYCCLRCCGCCGLGRGRRRARGQSNQPSMFNPMPYQGYQPANSNVAPPPYGQPPAAQYAQFDHPSAGGYRGAGKGGGGEDSLPAMPSWQDARSTRVEDHEADHHGQDVELGHLQKPAMASTTHLAPQQHGYTEADTHPVRSPHEAPPADYTGPDFSTNTAAAATTTSASAAGAAHYTGPDFSSPTQYQQQHNNTAYSAYAPSESTRYEPSYVNEPHELGTTYSNTLPPPSPSAQHTGFAGQSGAPGVLQAGRRPDGQQGAGGSWRDL